MIFGVVATLILGGLGFVRLVLLQPIAGRPLLLLGILLAVLAVQFISIGLLGEMIVRATDDSGQRSIYRVREELNSAPTPPAS